MRSLSGWCRETRQPVDLQLYVDDATLARVWSNVVHFQCPHCGTKHETEVQRLAAKPFSPELPKTQRTMHQHSARWHKVGNPRGAGARAALRNGRDPAPAGARDYRGALPASV
jgi:hypothetical protein